MAIRTALLMALTIVMSGAQAQAQKQAPKLSDGVVKIAVSEDMSGLYADASGLGSVAAARFAIADFGGKVLGMPIELVSADHQNKADIAAALAQKWYDVDKVDLIVGLGNSAAAIATQHVARSKNRMNIVTSAASSTLTGKDCSATGFHWVYDTYALAKGTGQATVKTGGDTWYFITVDYAFGHALQADVSKFVVEGGGKVLGSVRAPLNTPDFSSFLLQAQQSKAKIIGLATAGGDTVNSIKQAAEFGIVRGGQRLAGLLIFLTDVHGLGLQAAQGLVATNAFYWDTNEETRTFSRRYFNERKQMPNMIQAGVYSAVLHYLKAVQAAGTDDAAAVAAKVRELPINDFMTKNGRAREDGRVIRDMYLVQVKTPAESKYAWDYYKVLATIKGEDAFRPLKESDCPLVRK